MLQWPKVGINCYLYRYEKCYSPTQEHSVCFIICIIYTGAFRMLYHSVCFLYFQCFRRVGTFMVCSHFSYESWFSNLQILAKGYRLFTEENKVKLGRCLRRFLSPSQTFFNKRSKRSSIKRFSQDEGLKLQLNVL